MRNEINTTNYILNKCSTKKPEIKVYGEAWSRIKPSLKHLKVFSSLCSKHILDQRKSKLDEKSEIMLSYDIT